MESKELVFESWFIPDCFHLLPLGESLDVNSFVFETEIKVCRFLTVGFWQPQAPHCSRANCICMCVYSVCIYVYMIQPSHQFSFSAEP